RVLAHYLVDARSRLALYALDGSGNVGEIALPGIGEVAEITADRDSPDVFFRFSSMATPPSILRADLDSGAVADFKTPRTPFDPDDFVVEQVFYSSKDGTRVPMFLAYKRGLERTGDNPTMLYGYGGFNIATTPGFNPARLAWIDMGGVFALANLRGGSEYGEAW